MAKRSKAFIVRANATRFLKVMLQDTSLPLREAHDAARDFIAANFWAGPENITDAIHPMFVNWPNDALTYLIQEELEICLA